MPHLGTPPRIRHVFVLPDIFCLAEVKEHI